MKKKILIAGASSGWGHIQAARNIRAAISQVIPTSSVDQIDVFDYFPLGLKSLTNYAWRFGSCSAKSLYSSFYHRSVSSSGLHQILDLLVRTTARRIATEIDRAPDIFIATHSFAACVGSILKERFGCKLFVVATDFVVHSMQMRHNIDFLCVPPRCEYTSLSGFNSHRARILVTGIPIAPDFAIKKDPEYLRRKIGLSKDLVTVLVSFGGSGLRAELHLQQFRVLLDLNLPLQFIVLAGHNIKFAAAARNLFDSNHRKDRIKVFDFVEDVSDFYSAADIFIGKAGGLSVSEALAVGLPIIIIDSLPGQEEWNLRMLVSNGLGSFASNTFQLQSRIKSLVGGIDRSGKERGRHRFARPSSSNTVATCVASLAI